MAMLGLCAGLHSTLTCAILTGVPALQSSMGAAPDPLGQARDSLSPFLRNTLLCARLGTLLTPRPNSGLGQLLGTHDLDQTVPYTGLARPWFGAVCNIHSREEGGRKTN